MLYATAAMYASDAVGRALGFDDVAAKAALEAGGEVGGSGKGGELERERDSGIGKGAGSGKGGEGESRTSRLGGGGSGRVRGVVE